MSISKTRQKLVDVARQLFAKNGIANNANLPTEAYMMDGNMENGNPPTNNPINADNPNDTATGIFKNMNKKKLPNNSNANIIYTSVSTIF